MLNIKYLNRKYNIWVSRRQKWASFNYDFYDSGLCLTAKALRGLMRLTWEYRLLYGVCGMTAVGQVSGYYAKIPIEHTDGFVEKAIVILLDRRNLVLKGEVNKAVGATLFHGNTLTKRQEGFRKLLAENRVLLDKYIESRMGV